MIDETVKYVTTPTGEVIETQSISTPEFTVTTVAGDIASPDTAPVVTAAEYDAQVAADLAAQEAARIAAEADAIAVKPKHVKLYRYTPPGVSTDKFTPPFTLDYITSIDGRLNPTNSIVVQGEIRRVDYYATASAPNAQGIVTYSDLVLREDYAYTRDALGFARARLQTITWYCEDDTPHATTKTRLKYYENQQSLQEGQRRRGNIIDKMMMELSGWLVATQTQLASPQDRVNMGRDFMRYWKTSIDMFVEASQSQIYADVLADNVAAHSWIDSTYSAGVTVRQKMASDVNIWGLA